MRAGALGARRGTVLVARLELLRFGRGRFWFTTRTGWALLLVVLLPVLPFLESIHLRGPGLFDPRWLVSWASRTFGLLVILMGVGTMLLAFILGDYSLRSDRRAGRLGLLLLSRLSPSQIVTGKLLCVLSLVGLFGLALLPVLSILGWGGGIEMTTLIATTGMILLTAFTSTALGAVSGGGRFLGPGWVAGLVGLFVLVWLSVTGWLPGWFAETLFSVIPPGPFLILSPLYGTWVPADLVPSLLLYPLVGGLLLIEVRRRMATRALPALDGPYPWTTARARRIGEALPSRAHDPDRVNATLWLLVKDDDSRLSVPIRVLGLILTSVGVACFALWLQSHEPSADPYVIAGTVLLGMGLWMGASFLHQERERDRLALLLASPLTAGRILAGPLLGILSLYLLVSVIPLLVLSLARSAQGQSSLGVGIGFASLVALMLFGFTFACLASLRQENPWLAGTLGGLFCLLLFLAPMVGSLATEALTRLFGESFGTPMPLTGSVPAALALAVGWLILSLGCHLYGRLRDRPDLAFVGGLAAVLLGLGGFPLTGEPLSFYQSRTLLDATMDGVATATSALGVPWDTGVILALTGLGHIGLLTLVGLAATARLFDRSLGRAP